MKGFSDSNRNHSKKIGIFSNQKSFIRSDSTIYFDLTDLEQYGNYHHVEQFLDIPSMKFNDKRFLEYFFIDDISLWWFIAPSIHSKFKEAALFILRLNNFIDYHKLDVLQMNEYFDKKELVIQICKQKKIEFKISNKILLSYLLKYNLKSNLKKLRYKKIMKNKLQKRTENISFHQKTKNLRNDFVLFTSPGIYRRPAINVYKKNTSNQEFFIENIINYFDEKNYDILCVDLDYTFKGTRKILNERLSLTNNWIPVELFFNNHSRSSKTIEKIKKIRVGIEQLKSQKPYNEFKFQNISLWNYLSDSFDEMIFEPYLPTYLNLIESLEQFFSKNRPKLIIQTYEAGPYAKAFEYVAKKLKIKTFGIQHGLIPSDYPDYMFKEIFDNDPLGNMIPDKTLVFGEYYKQLLTTKGNYPENKVAVFGHPSYFEINEIKSYLEKLQSDTLSKNKTLKKILVPLSFRMSYIQNNPDKILLENLYQIFHNNPDLEFLIRPHPGDDLDQNMFDSLYPSNNFKISSSTLHEDLFFSDIVVLILGSTVAYEAIVFDKPVLLINISKIEHDKIDPIHNQMLDLKVCKLISIDDLSQTIEKIIENKISIKYSDDGQHEFLKLFFNNLKKPNFNIFDL